MVDTRQSHFAAGDAVGSTPRHDKAICSAPPDRTYAPEVARKRGLRIVSAGCIFAVLLAHTQPYSRERKCSDWILSARSGERWVRRHQSRRYLSGGFEVLRIKFRSEVHRGFQFTRSGTPSTEPAC